MEKVFEALETLLDKFGKQILKAEKLPLNATELTNVLEYLNRTPQVISIRQALTELQAIKEAKPSEALECLVVLEDCASVCGDYSERAETIRNALLNAQEQEKENTELKEALRIIKEKYVHIPQLLCAFENQLEEENPLEVYYNGQVGINVPMPLTEEEFELLKRWCEKCQK